MKIETNYFHIFFWELFPNFYDLSSQINLQNLYLSYFRASVSDPVAHSCRLSLTDKDHTGKACVVQSIQLILQERFNGQNSDGTQVVSQNGIQKISFHAHRQEFSK